MIALPNYKMLNKIYESTRSLVYRAQRVGDQPCPVILKVLKEDYPSPDNITRYYQEYEIVRKLDIPEVVKVYALEKFQNTLVIVLEDFNGKSLKQYLQRKRLTLEEFLTLAIEITKALGKIHAANIIHKDINPTNILIDPANRHIKLNDFGIASLLPKENPTFKNPEKLQGTLPYMSPEQTGRMNRFIDYRTDFYALGITFYEMLTQHLPFSTTEPIELVHCHLAKQPLAPHLLNPAIPEIISNVIMKLMEKTAESRYQSAWGIKTDLENILNQIRYQNSFTNFPLGLQDASDKLHLPQKLYGREQEIQTLLSSFELASLGNTELLLIAGRGGIGKSSLVHEIYKPITQKRGYFISGQFDQLKRDIPYSALIQAFRDLVQQILTESNISLINWQSKLLEELGEQAQLVVELIPELTRIIGSQLALVPLDSASENENRFNSAWKHFIQLFCQPQHPLVIFLDDLQWADTASLKLISVLMKDMPYLFLIGAYRENRVNATHPLQLTIENMKKTGIGVKTLCLRPLTLAHISEFLADTFSTSIEKTYELAELVLEKTQGNPFFINEFLKSLYEEKLIEFVPLFCQLPGQWLDKSENPNLWRWDLAKIKACNLADNVVELLSNKLQKLNHQTQQVLKLAACIGNSFDLKLLSTVYQKSCEETIHDLWESVVEGLILPTQEMYHAVAFDEQHPVACVEYKFAHDRIREAVYSLIPTIQKQIVHRRIGRALLEKMPSEQSEQNIFTVVEQLNFAIPLIKHPEEADEVAVLNLLAGRKAKDSAAYGPAFKHLKIGTELLGQDSWQRQYQLSLALFVETAELAYLSAQFADLERLVTTVLQNTESLLDQVKVYEAKIRALILQNKLPEAIETALMVLKLFNVQFPILPNPWHTKWGLLKIKFQLYRLRYQFTVTQSKTIKLILQALLNLPKMTNPYTLATMRILSLLHIAAYKAKPELFPLVVFKQVSLSIRQGNANESAFAYSALGMILGALENDVATASQFAEIALELVEKLEAKEVKARTLVIVNSHIKHWQAHLQDSLPILQEAHHIGLETGEIEFAALSINAYCYASYLVGNSLNICEKEAEAYTQTLLQLKHISGITVNEMLQQMLFNLSSLTGDTSEVTPCCLVGKYFDEDYSVPLLRQANDQSSLFLFHSSKLNLCYLFQYYEQALEHARLAESCLNGVMGFFGVPWFYFYDSLTCLALYERELNQASPSDPSNHSQVNIRSQDQPRSQDQQLLKKVLVNQKKMKEWADWAPMNYLHKYYLIEAERTRILGQHSLAREYYHKAIALAQRSEYLNEEALAYELTAHFYQLIQEEQLAHYYYRNAHHAYQRWGATSKVIDLEQRCAGIFFQPEGLLNFNQTIQPTLTASVSYSTEQNLVDIFDLKGVFKASQAISEELVLEKLLSKLMKIVLENAGAQHCTLLLMEKGELRIEAQGSVDQKQITVLQSLPLSRDSALPVSLINYVARSQELVILSEAAHSGKFTRDPYIIQHQIKSILCVPLLNQGGLIGLFYLENNLMKGAFTANRLEIVNLLSSQIAVSIKNARLYADTKALNYKLKESEERFRIIAETTPIPLVITRISDHIILYANAQMVKTFGLSTLEPLGHRSMTDFFYNPDEQMKLEQVYQQRNSIQNYELQLKRLDSSLLWMAMFSHPIIYLNEKVLLTALYDITARKQAEEERLLFTQQLAESEERFRVIAETSPIPLIIAKVSDGLILYANAQVNSIFGLMPTELMKGYKTTDFYHNPSERERMLAVFEQEGMVHNYEVSFQRRDNSVISVALFAQSIVFQGEQAMVTAIYDITDRKQAEEERIRFIQEREAKNAALQLNAKLQQEIVERQRAEEALAKANEELSRLAKLDGLTKVANRRYLDEYLNTEWRRMSREHLPLSLILCDIDYFKLYNDKYGHQAGDDCLRQVAQAMVRSVKRASDLVARYGGEEFAVILPNTSLEGAVQVATVMQQQVEALQIEHADSKVHAYVSLSIGVSSMIPNSNFLPEVLINMADNALYEAKRQGRNQVVASRQNF